MSDSKELDNGLIVNHLTLRNLIGICGILLPVVCLLYAAIVCGFDVENSISAYYYTHMRDVFVGILFAAGAFMLAYKGYDWDAWVSRFAGLCAILTACFGTDKWADHEAHLRVFELATVHNLAAGGLFISFAFMSIFLFTKSGEEVLSDEKKIRNVVYIICGWVIVACVAVMIAQMSGLTLIPTDLDPVFWLETISLFAFGFSWLVKGETLWPDKKPAAANAPNVDPVPGFGT
jgi:hypothetical protein